MQKRDIIGGGMFGQIGRVKFRSECMINNTVRRTGFLLVITKARPGSDFQPGPDPGIPAALLLLGPGFCRDWEGQFKYHNIYKSLISKLEGESCRNAEQEKS